MGTDELPSSPDGFICARETFGFDCPWPIPAFRAPTAWVPVHDEGYYFNPEITLAILAGFIHNRRTLVHGYHGTGKSTHIEQIAARLNWPCLRINLDGHVSRLDLVGRDAITVKDGQQVTEFREGLLPWAIQHPVALVFDEYDAGRPDIMFVIQRILEADGKFTLLDQNRVLTAHSSFRLFATANTIGRGDDRGLYSGTHPLNQGQLDRWNLVAELGYLSAKEEREIVCRRCPSYDHPGGRERVTAMVALAELTRNGFMQGDLSLVMSPRTVISWAENAVIFGDHRLAFHLTFFQRCDDEEKPLVCEYYQRCFDEELLSPADHHPAVQPQVPRGLATSS